MTFEQLLYFITAAEKDTFLSAADSLSISQSSLSKQIIRLEMELDLQLFDRSGRKARLTLAGEAFYQQARLLYRQYQEALEQMESFRHLQEHSLRLGTLPFLTQYHLTEKIRSFTELYPEISLSLEEVEEEALLSGFQKGDYDLVFTRFSLIDPSSHEFYPLAEDELTVVLPKNHRLSSRPSLTLEEIAEEPFIFMNKYTSIYHSCVHLFQERSLHPRVLRTARVESILSAVALGEGISLLGKSNFQVFHSDAVKALPLSPSVKLTVGAARMKKAKRKDSVKAFLSFLKTQNEG